MMGKAKCTTGKSNLKTDGEAFQRDSGDQHRNGEMAFGDDPLEFWEDWEGSMAEDIAEATPYGPAFQDYLLKQKPSPLSENPWDFWPGDRVVKYNEDEAFSVNNSPTTGFRRRRSRGRINCGTSFTTRNLEAMGAQIFE
jgi:hypothetical protein